jgi:hypothetical protein
VLERLACYLDTTQHPCQFLGTFLLRQRGNASSRGLPVSDFADSEMLVCETGNLGQMSYAQDLSVRAQFLQTTPYHFGDTAANATVYLIEDHCRYRAAIARDDLDGEAHA